MYMDGKESLKCIVELRSQIEKLYFKEFEGTLDGLNKINHTHIKTLMVLRLEGECSMSVVSDKVNLEKGSFTPVAHYLMEIGYIERTHDPKDKRVYNLRLTEEGRTFSNRLCEQHIQYIESLLDALTEHERNIYFASIQLVNDLTNKVQEAQNMG